MAVVQHNGVHALINTIMQGQEKEEILEPAICALRHITSRHSHAAEAQDAVRNVNGLLPIVDLLNPNLYSWPIIKSTISLIRNLALSPANLPILRETGAIEKLAQLLVRSHQELQRQQPNVELIDNYIRMDDILEACVSTLHIIAKDHQNRMIIRDLDCIPLFVRVRSSSIVRCICKATMFLAALSTVECFDSTRSSRGAVRIGQRSFSCWDDRTTELYSETHRIAQIHRRRRRSVTFGECFLTFVSSSSDLRCGDPLSSLRRKAIRDENTLLAGRTGSDVSRWSSDE